MIDVVTALVIAGATGAVSAALTLVGVKVELSLLSKRVDRIENKVFPVHNV
jgi:hypothetical protein